MLGVVVEHLVDDVGKTRLDRVAKEVENASLDATQKAFGEVLHHLVDG